MPRARARLGRRTERERGRRRADDERRRSPAAARLADVDDDDGDVVGRAAVEALLDEAVGDLLGAGVGRQICEDLVERHDAREPVGAEQPPVAGARVERSSVSISGEASTSPSTRMSTERRGCTVASSAVMRPLSTRRCTKVWSIGDLAELAVAEQVDARVADVGDRDSVADAQHAR